jgi:hypothetical protein
MGMYTYELWDIESRNLVEDFDDEKELQYALSEIGDLAGLTLAARDERGRTKWMGRGNEITRHFTPLPRPV